MRRFLAPIVLALPILGLIGGIALAEHDLRDATDWRIPITGYDPRDPLRGRYIRFQYVWRLAGDQRSCSDAGCRLCMEQDGRVVRIEARGASCSGGIDTRASGLSVFVAGAGEVSANTRLWVSEISAPVLETQLRAGPMVAVVKLTRDGRLVPERLEPAR